MENQYEARTFIEGDEAELVRLFNQAHDRYVGFVPKTEDYWKWCCRDRPDVSDEGIIIVEEKKSRKKAGYAVAGKSGNIWELCVDPNTDKWRVLSIIFEVATKYLEKAHAEQMILNVPSDDLAMQEACERLNFSAVTPDQMFIGITDFETLIEVLTNNSKKELASLKETITVQLLNARPWVNPTFSIKVDDEIKVFPNAMSSSINIKVDSDVFTRILLGESKPTIELLKGKLKIRPIRKIYKALKFLNAVQIRDPWFQPSSDYG